MSAQGQSSDSYAAEEILSAAIDKMLRSAHLFNPEKGKLFSWVYQIVKNCSYDFYKKQSDRQEAEIYYDSVPVEMQGQLSGMDYDEEFFEIYDRVDEAIEHLIPRDRQIIRYFMKGYNYDEIGSKLSMTNGHVRNRIHHIRTRLHTMLDVAA